MTVWAFRSIAFDNIAEKDLLKAIERDPTASLKLLKTDVQNNWAKLFAVLKDGERAGTFLLRKEYNGDIYELVVVAAGGIVGIEGMKACFTFFRKEALRGACSYIRMHVVRPGLMKLLKNDGYHEAERVYRTEV